MRASFEFTATGQDIMNWMPIAQVLRLTTNKWDFMQLKSFKKGNGTVVHGLWQHAE